MLGEGSTQEEVAKSVGISRSLVKWIKSKYMEEVKHLASQGLRASAIAEQLGIDPKFVEKCILELELKGAQDGPESSTGRSDSVRIPEERDAPSYIGEDRGEGVGLDEFPALPTGRQSTGGQVQDKKEVKKVEVEKGTDGEPQVVRLLRALLERLPGISATNVEAILGFVREDPDRYTNDPFQLMPVLGAYGIPYARQTFIVQYLFSALHGMPYPQMAMGMPNPGAPYPFFMPPRMEKKEEVDLDKYMKQYLQAATIQMLKGGQMSPAAVPWATVTQEPLVDSTGKVVKDETGTPILRTVVSPVPPRWFGGGQENREAKKEEGGKSELWELLKLERERALKLEDAVKDMIVKVSEERVKGLEDQIRAVASRNPLDDAVEIIEKMKKLGVAGEPNVEVARMNLDLQKWMHEKSMEYQKWLEEMRDKRVERQENLQRMQTFATTIKDGMKEAVVPMVQSFIGGYKEGQGMRKSFEAMSDQELEEYRRKAEETVSTISSLRSKIDEELSRRRVKAAPPPPPPPPPSPSEGGA
jgi:hypothetical protein